MVDVGSWIRCGESLDRRRDRLRVEEDWVDLEIRAFVVIVGIVPFDVFALNHRIAFGCVVLESWDRILGIDVG